MVVGTVISLSSGDSGNLLHIHCWSQPRADLASGHFSALWLRQAVISNCSGLPFVHHHTQSYAVYLLPREAVVWFPSKGVFLPLELHEARKLRGTVAWISFTRKPSIGFQLSRVLLAALQGSGCPCSPFPHSILRGPNSTS